MAYDIYIGTNDGEEATAHGAEYTYDGMNAADALTKLINDEHVMTEIRTQHPDLTELTASDDELTASIYPCDDGTWELHVYVGDADAAITIPPTEYVSITDAADMLDLSRQRVHVMLKNGQLHGRMVGNAWMVCRASVAARLAG